MPDAPLHSEERNGALLAPIHVSIAQARRAALFICGHAEEGEARELLEMCGLVPPQGAAS